MFFTEKICRTGFCSLFQLKGEPVAPEHRAQLSLGVELQIPVGYVEDPLQRLMVSKRLASARTEDKLEQLQAELRDRYGALPSEVDQLFAYASLRLVAEALGVLSIERKGDGVLMRLSEDAPIAMDRLLAQVSAQRGWTLTPPDGLAVATSTASLSGLMAAVREVLEALR